MMSPKIEFHVGLEDICSAVYDQKLQFEHDEARDKAIEELTRDEAWKCMLKTLYDRGAHYYPEGMDWNEIRDQITAKVDELFPDLKLPV